MKKLLLLLFFLLSACSNTFEDAELMCERFCDGQLLSIVYDFDGGAKVSCLKGDINISSIPVSYGGYLYRVNCLNSMY